MLVVPAFSVWDGTSVSYLCGCCLVFLFYCLLLLPRIFENHYFNFDLFWVNFESRGSLLLTRHVSVPQNERLADKKFCGKMGIHWKYRGFVLSLMNRALSSNYLPHIFLDKRLTESPKTAEGPSRPMGVPCRSFGDCYCCAPPKCFRLLMPCTCVFWFSVDFLLF